MTRVPVTVTVTVLLAAAWLAVTAGAAVAASACSADELVVYRLYVDTHWSRELFPKQYPEWRPPAGWSKMVGRTHDSTYWLFREGEAASAGLQAFAEKGVSDGLEAADHAGVYDEFTAPPLPRGAGRTAADFFLDGNHSLVSVALRVVPSPDWFIGVDSLDLCRGSHWIDSIAIEVDPMDAGTDNGFTFTAPNWPSEPREPVSRITSTRPAHPANSFYYPKLDQLPSIATLTFVKCGERGVPANESNGELEVTAPMTPSTGAVGASSRTSASPDKEDAGGISPAPATAADGDEWSTTETPPTPSASEDRTLAGSPPTSPAPSAVAVGVSTSPGPGADSLASAAPEGSGSKCSGSSCEVVRVARAATGTGGPREPAAATSPSSGSTEAAVAVPAAAAASSKGPSPARAPSAPRGMRGFAHACPARVPSITPSFAQTEMDDIDDLLEERVYHLSLELPRGAWNASRDRDQDLLEGNEISNDLPVSGTAGSGFTPEASPAAPAARTTNKARRSKKSGRQAKHCVVSEWSPWSACSASCGVGDAARSRRVLEHPRRGGRPCPALEEHRWCGGHSECPQNFFNW